MDLLDILVWGPNFTGELGGGGLRGEGGGSAEFPDPEDYRDAPWFGSELTLPTWTHPDAVAILEGLGLVVRLSDAGGLRAAAPAMPEPAAAAAVGLLAGVGALARRRGRRRN